MKFKFVLGAFAILISVAVFGQTSVEAKLESATVYLTGAGLNHTASVNLNTGVQNVVFSNVADNVDQNSLRVRAPGNIIIYSLNIRKNFIGEENLPAEVQNLKRKIQLLENTNSELADGIEVITLEIEMIAANKTQADGKALSIKQIKELGQYYQNRITDLKKETRTSKHKIRANEEKLTKLKKQLDELNAKFNKPRTEIVAEVNVQKAGQYNFSVSYLTHSANWQPNYFIRSAGIDSPITLEYRASVRQNSGLDWRNIPVVISTLNPVQSGVKPELPIWFLNFREELARKSLMKSSAMLQAVVAEADDISNYMNVAEAQTSVEFHPDLNYSIPSDNKSHTVALQKLTMNAEYKYYSVPKYNSKAFLVAEIKDFKNSTLLPGSAGVFFDGAYVGKTNVDPVNFDFAWQISLGADSRVSVNKKMLEDFSDEKFFGGNVERKFAFEITARNNRPAAIELLIEDNIPISRHEDIEVKLIDSSGAKLDAKTGKLTWRVKIEPGKSISRSLKYSVTYPKDKRLDNL